MICRRCKKGESILFNLCLQCISEASPADPQKAWQATKELRFHAGLDTVNLTELADEETGYRNVVVGGAETLMEQERYV